MFSRGQQVFAITFAIVFIGIMIWAYRKDIKLHRIHYRRLWRIGLAIIIVVASFAAIAFYLHN